VVGGNAAFYPRLSILAKKYLAKKYETVIFCLNMSQDFQKIKVIVKVELFD
jgi:hypothetical protein